MTYTQELIPTMAHVHEHWERWPHLHYPEGLHSHYPADEVLAGKHNDPKPRSTSDEGCESHEGG